MEQRGALKQEVCDETSAHSITMPGISKRRNRIKVLIAMSFAVTFGALGDVSLSKGMRMIGNANIQGPLHAFTATVTNFYVIAGVLLLLAFLMLYLTSLSWEDLSYVLPLTAVDYVLVTLFAYFLLHEQVNELRWAGSLLVAIGIALVARS